VDMTNVQRDLGVVDRKVGELTPRVELLEEVRRENTGFCQWDGNWKRSMDGMVEEIRMILGGHQRDILAMKDLLEVQMRTINTQNTLIQGLLAQVWNLQVVVDPVGEVC
jgi:hypothetical protein